MTLTDDHRRRVDSWRCLCLCLLFYSAASGQPNAMRAFMEERIVCDRYVFPPGEFPACRWNDASSVERELGRIPLTVSYYDREYHRVTSAVAPGRYGAVIEGTAPSGFVIRRYVTLFCTPAEFDDYSMNVPVRMNKLREYGIPEKNWDAYTQREERFAFGSMKYFPQRDPDAAIFLAGLYEMDSENAIDDTPRIRDRQWWIGMKGRLETPSVAVRTLRLPQPAATHAPPMSARTIVPPSAMKARIDSLRAVCRAWTKKSGVGHVTLVALKGKILFHEAFGSDEQGTVLTTSSRMWMASITKLLTGVLMMRFVDQGFVDLDAPVGRYLPELERAQNDTLTVRRLFTHTTGLSFAGEWASDWNPALDNQVAQVLPYVEIGSSFSYHRIGYALAGKIMERITGRAVPYLFREHVFTPLGMTTAYSDNTYGGLYCTSMDLARFGQMLLQRGTSNGCTLFSDVVFEKMLPRQLPVGIRRWGIGTTPMSGHGLSDAAFGHGAASGTVFRIDPVNELVIISARNTAGKFHDEFEHALLERCAALVRR